MIARKAGLVKENPSAAVHTLFLGETNALPPRKNPNPAEFDRVWVNSASFTPSQGFSEYGRRPG